mgnify:CR=1 FL=1
MSKKDRKKATPEAVAPTAATARKVRKKAYEAELARLQVEEAVRIDGDGVGFDGGGRGDGAGDDLALGHKAFDAGVDQAFAKLVEIENAGNKDSEAGKVEDEDPARQRGKYIMAEYAPYRFEQACKEGRA